MPEARAQRAAVHEPDRRSSHRHKMVLRVGLLQAEGRTSFCLVKNISASGVQVKLYGNLESGCAVSLTVGDEAPLRGRLKWVNAALAGIEFDDSIPRSSLLRVTQKLSPSRRRSSPRANTAARVILTSNGRPVPAQLCDISTSGARVRTSRPIVPDSTVLLGVPGLPPLRAFVRWADEEELGLSFTAPIPIEIIAGWLDERTLIGL